MKPGPKAASVPGPRRPQTLGPQARRPPLRGTQALRTPTSPGTDDSRSHPSAGPQAGPQDGPHGRPHAGSGRLTTPRPTPPRPGRVDRRPHPWPCFTWIPDSRSHRPDLPTVHSLPDSSSAPRQFLRSPAGARCQDGVPRHARPSPSASGRAHPARETRFHGKPQTTRVNRRRPHTSPAAMLRRPIQPGRLPSTSRAASAPAHQPRASAGARASAQASPLVAPTVELSGPPRTPPGAVRGLRSRGTGLVDGRSGRSPLRLKRPRPSDPGGPCSTPPPPSRASARSCSAGPRRHSVGAPLRVFHHGASRPRGGWEHRVLVPVARCRPDGFRSRTPSFHVKRRQRASPGWPSGTPHL